VRFLLVKTMPEAHCYSQFVNSLDRALTGLGHETVVSDQHVHVVDRAADVSHLVAELQRGHFDVVMSFSSFFGAVTLQSGVSLFDALGVKFLGWQLDHPIYTPQALDRRLQARYSIYSNHNHVRFAQAIKLPGRGKAMLPAGEPLGEPVREWRDRPRTLLVAATWNGVPQAPWEGLPDTPAKKLLVGVIDRLLADREASLVDAFNQTAAKLRLPAQLGASPAFDDQMIAFLRDPLTYVRHVDRIGVVQALADAGFPMTVCGAGWRGFLGERPNVEYIDEWVAFSDLPSLYGSAKLVLNLNAGNGGCERAIQAALAGATAVSDHSEQLAGLFALGEEAAFFNRAKPGHVVDVVGRLLESGKGEAIAEGGHRKAMRAALWTHRAQELVAYLGG
jgi:hypothetical protein